MKGIENLNETRCRVCGITFHDDPPKTFHDSLTAEDKLRMHVFRMVNHYGDAKHMLAYPEWFADYYVKQIQGEDVDILLDPEGWTKGAVVTVQGKYILFYYVGGGNMVEDDQRIHGFIDGRKSWRQIKEILNDLERKFFSAPSAFKAIKVRVGRRKLWMIFSGNGDSDIDRYLALR